MDHRNNFDLIRLYAALQVVLVHGFDHLKLPTGGLIWAVAPFPGVPIFFIISGFLIAGSFMNSRSTGNFFYKRSLRIYPALVVNILVLEALVYAGGSSAIYDLWEYTQYLVVYVVTASSDIAYKLSGIHYPYSFGDSYFFFRYPSGVLWTLTVEIGFYVAAAVALGVVKWRRGVGIALLACLCLLSMWWASDLREAAKQSQYAQIFFLPFFWVFAVGIFAQLYWSKIERLFRGTFVLWLGVYVALTAICIYSGNGWYVDFKAVTPLVVLRMTLLGAVVLSGAYSFRGLATALLRGQDLSYGIYLYHMLVVCVLVGLGYKAGSAWVWALLFGGATAFALLSWFLVEKPALALKKSGRGGGTPMARTTLPST